MMSPLGLYLHIPFCSALCSYCNFRRELLDAGLKVRYVDALAREIVRAGDGSATETIYFGGGTPSLLEPAEVATLIDACRRSFDLATHAEITIEVNPETTSAEQLDGFRAAGVNRLSWASNPSGTRSSVVSIACTTPPARARPTGSLGRQGSTTSALTL